jgi:uncharacterized protein (TIGR03435 family)
MDENSDMDLLRQYADNQSESAFASLVSRHMNLVYSAALRKTGNPHVAEEITQVVFVILAQKAERIPTKTVLAGWLYQTARLTASSFLKLEARRARREQETYMQNELGATAPDETWKQLAPLLEDAMGYLGERERAAVVGRYYAGQSLAELAMASGITENAAKKRIHRALEKLHRYFAKRGVASTAATIAGAISVNSVQAAPAALANAVTAVALGKGATASGSTLTLIKGALKLMAWTKAKTAIVAGVVVLLAAGTTPLVIKEIQEHRTYPWQVAGFDGQRLNQAPSQVAILRSKIGKRSSMGNNTAGKMMGTGVTAQSVVGAAYGLVMPTRTVAFKGLPDGRFDFIATLPNGNKEALQQEVKRKFGVIASRETREADVLLLKLHHSNASSLTPSTAKRVSVNANNNQLSFTGCTMDSLAANLEPILKIPILNQTGLPGNFDMELKWDDRKPEGLKQAVLDQLGLELVPGREPVEMLVVEKVK